MYMFFDIKKWTFTELKLYIYLMGTNIIITCSPLLIVLTQLVEEFLEYKMSKILFKVLFILKNFYF